MRPARSMRRSHCRQAHSRRVAESCVFMLPVLLSILVVQAHQAWGPPLAFSTPMALPKRAARLWCAQSRTCSPTRRVRMAGAEEGQSLSDEDWRAFRARLVQTGISTRTQNESKATQPARHLEEPCRVPQRWRHWYRPFHFCRQTFAGLSLRGRAHCSRRLRLSIIFVCLSWSQLSWWVLNPGIPYGRR